MLRILAERNRPHGQMLGEEAQEALQGKKQGVPTPDDLCMAVTVTPTTTTTPLRHGGGFWGLSRF